MTRSQRLSDQPHAGRCAGCGALLAHDQRYCVNCGTRRGPLPPDVEAMIRDLRHVSPVALAAPEGAEEVSDRWQLPTPRVASLCVMAMLSFGVIAGSLSQPGGAESLARTLVVSLSPPAPQQVASVAGDNGGGGGGSSGGGGPATITETITQPAPTTSAGGGSSAGSG